MPKIKKETKKDPGAHYRYTFYEHKLDPFLIAKIYKMDDFALMTILKKCLCAGNRGHKDKVQDLKDIISAAERGIEIELELKENPL